MDVIEFAIVGVLAAAMLVVGPLLVALWWFKSGQVLSAVVCLVLWLLVLVSSLLDWKRRRVGGLSVTLGFVWLVITLTLWWWLAG